LRSFENQKGLDTVGAAEAEVLTTLATEATTKATLDTATKATLDTTTKATLDTATKATLDTTTKATLDTTTKATLDTTLDTTDALDTTLDRLTTAVANHAGATDVGPAADLREDEEGAAEATLGDEVTLEATSLDTTTDTALDTPLDTTLNATLDTAAEATTTETATEATLSTKATNAALDTTLDVTGLVTSLIAGVTTLNQGAWRKHENGGAKARSPAEARTEALAIEGREGWVSLEVTVDPLGRNLLRHGDYGQKAQSHDGDSQNTRKRCHINLKKWFCSFLG
jgi:hypothetical protein